MSEKTESQAVELIKQTLTKGIEDMHKMGRAFDASGRVLARLSEEGAPSWTRWQVRGDRGLRNV